MKFSILNFQFSIFICLLGYLFIGLFPKSAYADFNVAVYPPIIQVDTTAPANIYSPFAIENFSSDPVTLQIHIAPFQADTSGTGGIVQNAEFSGNDVLIRQRIHIESTDGTEVSSVMLNPQQQKKFQLHVELPPGEPPSDYYFTILFIRNSDDTSSNPNVSQVVGGIGINTLLSIGPKAPASGILKDFSTNWFYESGPVAFTVDVMNTSNYFITPKGNITINNMFGQTVGSLDFLPTNILAHSDRLLPNVAAADAKSIWDERFLFGLYSAHLKLLLTPDGPFFEKTIYFLAIPIWGFLIFFGLAGLIAYIIIRVRKRLKNK